MTTPIYNFVQNYINSKPVRFHMPGHKGQGALGIEAFDITEIEGADVLYSPSGIIAESEENATALFGTAHSFYSTEGSTLAIKAMLKLATQNAPRGERAMILAGRNAHKAFIYAAALLDLDVEWLFGEEGSHLCECRITPDSLEKRLSEMEKLPAAIYVTSPDYLGNIADIRGISMVADRYDIPVLVDNAHGAYLRFVEPCMHPIALGASMCCDSAHKTLPVLTGGAYLHIARRAERLVPAARGALSLFASTSPSYLTLQSLDLANAYLQDGYSEKLAAAVKEAEAVKAEISALGFMPEQTEPLKIVIRASKYGYTGDELKEKLRSHAIECEFSDRDYLVLMLSPENTDPGDEDYRRLVTALSELTACEAINTALPKIPVGERKLTVREAIFGKSETVKVKDARGRILAAPTVSCPPAVPVATSGEALCEEAISALLYYGITEIEVICED